MFRVYLYSTLFLMSCSSQHGKSKKPSQERELHTNELEIIIDTGDIIATVLDVSSDKHQLKIYDRNLQRAVFITYVASGLLMKGHAEDINNDSNLDIILDYVENRPYSLCFVFDKSENTWVWMSNFKYPNIQRFDDSSFLSCKHYNCKYVAELIKFVSFDSMATIYALEFDECEKYIIERNLINRDIVQYSSDDENLLSDRGKNILRTLLSLNYD